MKNRSKLIIILAAFTGLQVTASQQLWNIVNVVKFAKAEFPAPTKQSSTSLAALAQHKTLSGLQKALSGTTIGTQSANFSKLSVSGNYPEYLNFLLGRFGGFAFFSNPWNSNGPIAADLTKLVAQVDWSKGIKFLPLAFDSAGNFVPHLGKAETIDPYLFVYDSSDNLLGVKHLPISRATKGKEATVTSGVDYGVASSNSAIEYTHYPAVFTLVGPSASIKQSPTSLAALKKHKTLSGLRKALSGTTIGTQSATFSKLSESGNYPAYLNFLLGRFGGFAFFSNPWNSNGPIAADLTKLVAQIDWSKGIKFLPLAFDLAGNFVPHLGKAETIDPYLFVYDSSDNLLGVKHIPLSRAIAGAKATVTSGVDYGVASSTAIEYTSYPAIFTLTGPAPKA
ncbi:MAG: hypothetical protein WC747_02870 [Candidatus Babeliales bacterium]|jgi:hypothetical protein